jgi:hypothetical protein
MTILGIKSIVFIIKGRPNVQKGIKRSLKMNINNPMEEEESAPDNSFKRLGFWVIELEEKISFR